MNDDRKNKPRWFVNPFRSKDEEALSERIIELENELEEQKEKSRSDRRKLLQVEADLIDARLHKDRMNAIHEENGRLRQQIKESTRKQNEADLYFLSGQIMRELESGKKKDDQSVKTHTERQLALQQQMGICNDLHRAQLGSAGFGGRQGNFLSALGGAL
jgi:GTPase involved in cell partitioning and DNA repair